MNQSIKRLFDKIERDRSASSKETNSVISKKSVDRIYRQMRPKGNENLRSSANSNSGYFTFEMFKNSVKANSKSIQGLKRSLLHPEAQMLDLSRDTKKSVAQSNSFYRTYNTKNSSVDSGAKITQGQEKGYSTGLNNRKNVSKSEYFPQPDAMSLSKEDHESSLAHELHIKPLYDNLTNYQKDFLDLKDFSITQFCINHPEKQSEFFVKSVQLPEKPDKRGGLCASCAVRYAGFSLVIDELVLTGEAFTRKQQIDKFLRKIDFCLEAFTSKQSELKAVKNHLHKQFECQRQKIERAFMVLLNMVEKRKYLWEENLKHCYLMEKQSLDSKLETAGAYMNYIEKIKSDITDNYQNIMDKVSEHDFKEIFHHHNIQMDERFEFLNKSVCLPFRFIEKLDVKTFIDKTENFIETELRASYSGHYTLKSPPAKIAGLTFQKLSSQYLDLNPLINDITSIKDDFFTQNGSIGEKEHNNIYTNANIPSIDNFVEDKRPTLGRKPVSKFSPFEKAKVSKSQMRSTRTDKHVITVPKNVFNPKQALR